MQPMQAERVLPFLPGRKEHEQLKRGLEQRCVYASQTGNKQFDHDESMCSSRVLSKEA